MLTRAAVVPPTRPPNLAPDVLELLLRSGPPVDVVGEHRGRAKGARPQALAVRAGAGAERVVLEQLQPVLLAPRPAPPLCRPRLPWCERVMEFVRKVLVFGVVFLQASYLPSLSAEYMEPWRWRIACVCCVLIWRFRLSTSPSRCPELCTPEKT